MHSRHLVWTLLWLAWTAPLAAQDVAAGPATEPAQPSAETAPEKPLPLPAVLRHVPRDAMGFVVVPNVARTLQRAEKFATGLGLGPILQQHAPQGLLTVLKTQLKLGEGLNAEGGFAAVLLRPQKYGIEPEEFRRRVFPWGGGGIVRVDVDLVQPGGAQPGATQPEEPPKPKPMPLVLLLPGEGVQAVLGAHEPKAKGAYWQLGADTDPTYAAARGGYVLISQNLQALRDVRAVTPVQSVATVLNGRQKALLARGDVAAHGDMRVLGPILQEALLAAEKAMREDHGFGGGMGMMLLMMMPPVVPAMYITTPQTPYYRYMLGEMTGLAATLRLENDGLLADFLSEWKEGSPYVRAYRANAGKPGRGPKLVARLPNRQPVLAIGAAPERGEAGLALEMKRVDGILASPLTEKLSKAGRQRVRKLARRLAEAVDRWQFVVGAGPDGGGLVGTALVLEGTSAKAIRGVLADLPAELDAIYKAQLGEGEGVPADWPRLVWREGLETVGDVKADVLEVQHPELVRMDEEARRRLNIVLGEDKVRILVAAPDAGTVVLTLTGGTPFLAEALKAAWRGGGIDGDPNVRAALRQLPDGASTLGLFSEANVFALLKRIYHEMEGGEWQVPFAFNCPVPAAYGSAAEGPAKHGVLFIPSGILRDLAAPYVMMSQGGGF